MQVVGINLNLVGLEDFTSNRRAVGRLEDLADLEAPEPSKAHGS